jgi:hypothetical protein
MKKIKSPFAYKVIRRCKDCLSRQVGEAIQIQHTGDSMLNSKCEYLFLQQHLQAVSDEGLIGEDEERKSRRGRGREGKARS